jgi:hypothetical protein
LLDGASKMHPLYLVTLVGSYAEADKVWSELANDKLSWGAFNQRRKEISTLLTTNMAQVNIQIGSQLQNQYQYEMEQRQRAAAAMQQWAYQQQVLANQQQAILAASQPRMTTINCNYYGNTASCNSF